MIPRKVHKRTSVRFNSDPNAIAQVDIGKGPDGEAFYPTVLGLVADESTRGCGIILIEIPELVVGDKCKVQVGKLHPMKAEVRWRKVIDAGVLRLGLLYLE